MAGFSSITPNININTSSGQLRTELGNTFARLDGQLKFAPYRLATASGPVGCVGATETTLMSTTIDHGTLNALGNSLLIFAAGKTNANVNNKTFKLVLGTTTLFTSGALALNNVDWAFQAEVVFNGGSSQISWAQFNRNGSSPIVTTTTATENFSNSLTLKITGTGAATDDISSYYWKVLLLN